MTLDHTMKCIRRCNFWGVIQPQRLQAPMWEKCLEETRLSHSDVLAQAAAEGCVWAQGSAALGVSEDVCGLC